MWKFLASACLIGIVIGCGSAAEEKMGSGKITEDWAERDALVDSLMGAGMAMEMGSKSPGKELDATAFKAALDAFSASTAPGGYDDTKKAGVATAGEALLEAAKGDAKGFKEKYDAFMKALSETIVQSSN